MDIIYNYATKKKSPPLPPVRPKANIDWNLVGLMGAAGCPTTEIASKLGISTDTIYNRCIDDNGVTFSAFIQEKKASGEANLRLKQYQKALKGDGNIQMLIHLGKFRLGQIESKMEVDNAPPQEKILQLEDEIIKLKALIRQKENNVSTKPEAGI